MFCWMNSMIQKDNASAMPILKFIRINICLILALILLIVQCLIYYDYINLTNLDTRAWVCLGLPVFIIMLGGLQVIIYLLIRVSSRRRVRVVAMKIALGIMLLAYVMFAAGTILNQDDCCLVIALNVAQRIETNGSISNQEINDMIYGFIYAGVINGGGTESAPADSLGNPFVITIGDSSVTVSTERSVWQPINVERKADINPHNLALHRFAAGAAQR